MIKKRHDNYAIFGVKNKRKYADDAHGAIHQFMTEAIDLFIEWSKYTACKIDSNSVFWEKVAEDYPKVYEVLFDDAFGVSDQPVKRNKFKRHVDLGAFYSVSIRNEDHKECAKYQYFVILEFRSAEMEHLHETMRMLGDSLRGTHFLGLINRHTTDLVDLFLKQDFYREEI